MIAVHMPLTPSPVDNHLSFVILLCVIFANYEDWRRVGGATCVICPSVWNDTYTTTSSNATFDLQLEKLRVSIPETHPSLPFKSHWLVPCAQRLDTSSGMVTSSAKTRHELLAWDERINQVSMAFDQYMSDDVQLPQSKILDDGAAFEVRQDGKRYYTAPNGARVTLSPDNSSIALDVSGNVVRISSDRIISSKRSDGTQMQLSRVRDSMFVTMTNGTEIAITFSDSAAVSTATAPNYKHAHWFLSESVLPYKVAGDGRSITCATLCNPQAGPTLSGSKLPQSQQKSPKYPDSTTLPEIDFADAQDESPAVSSVAANSTNYCGAWLSDGTKCFLYDRRSINVSQVVPVCWTPGPDDLPPPAPFVRWGAVAADLELDQTDDAPAHKITRAINADAVVTLAEQYNPHPAWAWFFWLLNGAWQACTILSTIVIAVCFLGSVYRHGFMLSHSEHIW